MKKVLLSLLLVVFMMPFAVKAQLNVPRAIIIVDTVACDSFAWNANTYTNDTVFLDVHGDTMYVINLTVRPTFNITSEVAANCSYTMGNNTYTQAGQYSDTLQTVDGCDSIVTLTLTLTGTDTVQFNDTVCQYYSWNGMKITTNGNHIYQDTVTGCTTLGIFDLHIITPYQVDSNAVSSIKDSLRCGKYKYGKITYYESTYINDTTSFRTIDKCYDSIFSLYLEIFPKYLDTTYLESCGYTTFAGQSYYESVTNKTVKLGLTTHKCDSSTVLNLTVKPAPSIESIDGNYLIHPNETANLAATVSITPFSNETPTYEWRYDGQTANTDAISIPNVLTNTDVTLTVRLQNGCEDRRSVTIIPYDNSSIDVVEEARVNIYPNPTTTLINVISPVNMKQVDIYSLDGKKIDTYRDLGTLKTIKIHDYAFGIYTVCITLENGQTVSRKFMVDRRR